MIKLYKDSITVKFNEGTHRYTVSEDGQTWDYKPLISEIARFAKKIARQGDCWEWTANKNWKGYGIFKYRGKQIKAHRFAYLLKGIGAVPAELVTDHICQNRACVKPSHLRAVTNQENLARGKDKWANKTHCNHGHDNSTPDSFYQYNGIRYCKVCALNRQRSWRQKKGINGHYAD